MDRLTLDSNALRDWAWAEDLTGEDRHRGSSEREPIRNAYRSLTGLRDAGVCELAVPPQIYSDFWQSNGAAPAGLAALIGSVVELTTPSLTTYPIHFPAVFFNEEALETIFRVVYPSSKTTDARYDSHRRDALLLYAHCKASRDFFVTSDGAILNAAARLEKEWSITVSGIRDYVARN